eukprot:3335660-Amphidinium_carterae.2
MSKRAISYGVVCGVSSVPTQTGTGKTSQNKLNAKQVCNTKFNWWDDDLPRAMTFTRHYNLGVYEEGDTSPPTFLPLGCHSQCRSVSKEFLHIYMGSSAEPVTGHHPPLLAL